MSNTKLLTCEELPEGINIKSIVVGSEQAKEQLLLAIRYLHDLRNIDTDIAAINELVHLYHVPSRITVMDDNNESTSACNEQSKQQLLSNSGNTGTDFISVNELVDIYSYGSSDNLSITDNDIWHRDVVICKKFTKEQLLPLFEPGSWFMKKILNGPFYGEFGHPIKESGMTISDWTDRLIRVNVNNVCVVIRSVCINSKGELVGTIKFIGPHKKQLQTGLLSGGITLEARALVQHQNENDNKILDIAAFDVLGCE